MNNSSEIVISTNNTTLPQVETQGPSSLEAIIIKQVIASMESEIILLKQSVTELVSKLSYMESSQTSLLAQINTHTEQLANH